MFIDWTLKTFTTKTYLESDHDGCGEVEFSCCSNDALSDDIAPHDTTENIDHDGINLEQISIVCLELNCCCFAHLGVTSDDFESFFHLVGSGATTNVEEVGGAAAMELDDVHGGHGEAGAVDHAPNVTVQGDVVEVVLGWEIWLQFTGLGQLTVI